MINVIKTLTDRVSGKAPKGAKRSGGWRKVRKAFIKKYPRCFVCRSKKKIEVHHKVPFSLAPDLELEESNLITLCDKKNIGCHFVFGHLKSWRSFNINIDLDATIWHQKIKTRP